MRVVLVAAVGPDGAIGVRGGLPWRMPGDLARFRALTLGNPVVMGRRTWDSLPRRPLPGRMNLVVSRTPDAVSGADGAFASLEGALEAAAASGAAECCVAGGGEIYALALASASRMELTLVGRGVPGADAFFPAWDPAEWRETARLPSPDAGFDACFATLERKEKAR